MNAIPAFPTSAPAGSGRLSEWILRALALAWAGFWTWFVLLDGLHDLQELGPATLLPMAAVLAGVLVPVVLAWRRPRHGAIAFAASAIVALLVFRGGWAWLLLAAPAADLALGFGLLAWRRRPGARPS